MKPQVVCVLTHGDGDTRACLRSLRAILAQDAAEFILVDHASQPLTLVPKDDRVRLVRLAPSSPATARNRALHILGLEATARNLWIWLLTPGDTPAPFALRELTARLQESAEQISAPDLVFLPGLCRTESRVIPLMGQEALAVAENAVWAPPANPALPALPRLNAALIAPVPAMRLVRAEWVRRIGLRFADDQDGGEMLFATAATLGADTIARCPIPVFARDMRPRRPLSHAHLRDATQALMVIAASPFVNEPTLRLSLLGSLAREITNRTRPESEVVQSALESHTALVLARADRRIRWSLSETNRQATQDLLSKPAPWLADALAALSRLAAGHVDKPDTFSSGPEIRKLSVVIPVHNDTEGLQRLLATLLPLSIVSELVIVDDGSMIPVRETLADLETLVGVDVLWLREDPDEHGKGSGAGAARNRGQAAATGSHVLFLDADDTVYPALGTLWKALGTMDFDVAIFAHNDSRRVDHGQTGPDEAVDRAIWTELGAESAPRVLSLTEASALCRISNYPWNKIWRRTFLESAGIRCTEIPLHNDIEPHWAAFLSTERLLVSGSAGVLHNVAHNTTQLSNRRDVARLRLFEALQAVLERLEREIQHRPEHVIFLGPFLDFTVRLCNWVETVLADSAATKILRDMERAFLISVASRPAPINTAFERALAEEPSLAEHVLNLLTER